MLSKLQIRDSNHASMQTRCKPLTVLHKSYAHIFNLILQNLVLEPKCSHDEKYFFLYTYICWKYSRFLVISICKLSADDTIFDTDRN